MSSSDPSQSFELPEDWFDLDVPHDVDLDKPGIYIWEIEGAGKYVGKYTRIERPTKQYGRNVRRIFSGRPYHDKSKPDGFRHIHRELAKAHREGRKIILHIPENVPNPEARHAREGELIAECGNLNRSGDRPSDLEPGKME